jgi:hypothetical protein
MEMGRYRASRAGLIKTLLLLAPLALPGQGAAVDTSLKLLISVEQQNIAAPFPARVTLHFHNAGNETVWLYHHAQGKLPPLRPVLEEDTTPQSTGGSMLTVKLEPASAGQATTSNPAQATIFESVGLPKPKLVELAPGEDYEEKASIRLTPALSELQKPIWGTYRVSLLYAAQYSNAEDIHHNLKVTVWQGEVSSNTIEVQLQPPSSEWRGQVIGTVGTPDSALIRDARTNTSWTRRRATQRAGMRFPTFHPAFIGLRRAATGPPKIRQFSGMSGSRPLSFLLIRNW